MHTQHYTQDLKPGDRTPVRRFLDETISSKGEIVMKNYQIDWTLYDQIERNRKEKAAAEWKEKVDHAKRIGSLQARIQAAAIVIALMMALILIPEPIKRWW